MSTVRPTSTTQMQVTSIRFEQELKDKLKELAGQQGYQALIREILWNYVHQKSKNFQSQISLSDIQATVAATAQQEAECALTGQSIPAQEAMLLGLTTSGQMVPLRLESLAS
ncbi:MAG TPA: hypothetical protein V6D03_02715 [Candidatus Caenarcaniphilales bacterium]